MTDLTRAIAEQEGERVATARAPLVEARVRDARAEELDFVAAEFERSANRVEKAKGATERTKFMRDMVDVLRNRAREVRR